MDELGKDSTDQVWTRQSNRRSKLGCGIALSIIRAASLRPMIDAVVTSDGHVKHSQSCPDRSAQRSEFLISISKNASLGRGK